MPPRRPGPLRRLRRPGHLRRRLRPGHQPRHRRPGLYGPAFGRSCLYGPAALLCLTLIGCGVLSPEEQLLTRFFEAARLHDTTRMARLGSATFDPRLEGFVDAFEIERVERSEDGRSERLTIRADVRTFGGRRLTQHYDVALIQKEGRWFITAIATRPAGP